MAAPARLPKVNSYEDGTIVPPWCEQQAPPGRITVVPSPTDATRKVMRVELRGDDRYRGAARAEVVDRKGPRDDPNTYPNWPDHLQERWYGWKTYLAPGFPSPGWTTIAQWHSHNSDVLAPPFAIVVDRGRFEFFHMHRNFVDANGDEWRDGEAATGTWHTFLFHVRWSPHADKGFAELWHNGVNVVPRTSSVTTAPDRTFDGDRRALSPPAPVYVKQGLYRDPSIRETQVAYHDAMRIGTARAHVEP
jgi:hypothetical protein